MSLSNSFEDAAKPVVSFRMSTEPDVARLLAFYEENPHPDIYKRDPEDIKNNIVTGRALIVEKDGDIIMSSIGYDFKNPDAESGRPAWIEFGSTLCKPEDRGLGLYPFVIAAQTVHEFLNRPRRNFLWEPSLIPLKAFLGCSTTRWAGIASPLRRNCWISPT